MEGVSRRCSLLLSFFFFPTCLFFFSLPGSCCCRGAIPVGRARAVLCAEVQPARDMCQALLHHHCGVKKKVGQETRFGRAEDWTVTSLATGVGTENCQRQPASGQSTGQSGQPLPSRSHGTVYGPAAALASGRGSRSPRGCFGSCRVPSHQLHSPG